MYRNSIRELACADIAVYKLCILVSVMICAKIMKLNQDYLLIFISLRQFDELPNF